MTHLLPSFNLTSNPSKPTHASPWSFFPGFTHGPFLEPPTSGVAPLRSQFLRLSSSKTVPAGPNFCAEESLSNDRTPENLAHMGLHQVKTKKRKGRSRLLTALAAVVCPPTFLFGGRHSLTQDLKTHTEKLDACKQEAFQRHLATN